MLVLEKYRVCYGMSECSLYLSIIILLLSLCSLDASSQVASLLQNVVQPLKKMPGSDSGVGESVLKYPAKSIVSEFSEVCQYVCMLNWWSKCGKRQLNFS